MRLLLIGPQGSGKGTQAERLSKLLNIPMIGMGEILRQEIKQGTVRSEVIHDLVSAGKMVLDPMSNEIAKVRITKPDCENGFILDGYPRTTIQANFLDEFAKPDAVIIIEVPEDVSIERLSARWQCRKEGHVYGLAKQPKVEGVCDDDGSELYQREDDKPDAIRKRLAFYNDQTKDVIDHYEKQGTVKRIDGTKSPDEVFEMIKSVIQTSA